MPLTQFGRVPRIVKKAIGNCASVETNPAHTAKQPVNPHNNIAGKVRTVPK